VTKRLALEAAARETYLAPRKDSQGPLYKPGVPQILVVGRVAVREGSFSSFPPHWSQ
jgi:hypothetical protein